MSQFRSAARFGQNARKKTRAAYAAEAIRLEKAKNPGIPI